MKRLFLLFASTTAMLFAACSNEFDDSEIWDSINDHENRISKLEELCRQMNTNISSLQTIVTALQGNDYITGVTPITDNGATIGYTITFAKAQSITIYHGKDGKDGQNGTDGKDGVDGKDGSTPIIGVKQDTDNIYYWTLNGDWLLDDDGNKIKAQGTDGKNGTTGPQGPAGADGEDGEDGSDGTNGTDGKDGITPQLKIEDGYWYISYNNGSTWGQLGKATGEDGIQGDSFFQSVAQDDKFLYLTLNDGTEVSIIKADAIYASKIVYIPRYDDGNSFVQYIPSQSSVTFDFEVVPQSAIHHITKNWEKSISAKAVSTLTRATPQLIDMPVLGCDIDADNGIFSVTCSAVNLEEEIQTGKLSVSARVVITTDINTIASEYIPLKASPFEYTLTYSTSNNTALNIDDDIFDAKIYQHSYIDDKGYITFETRPSLIKEAAFKGEAFLKSIDIPDGVTAIGKEAFSGCTALTDITLSESLKEIKSRTFANCSALKEITLPNSLTDIESAAFAGCYALESFEGKFATADKLGVVVGDTFVAYALGSKTSTYAIPKGVITVGDSAFRNETDENGYLNTIVVPLSVSHIESNAMNNISVESIYCRGFIPAQPALTDQNEWNVFNETTTTLFVPESAIDVYQNNSYWNEYTLKSIKEYISSDYSQNGQIATLQTATQGNGINIIIMGDAYPDALIADGTFAEYAEIAMDTFFDIEPYRSFRYLFNVYSMSFASKKAVIPYDTASNNCQTPSNGAEIETALGVFLVNKESATTRAYKEDVIYGYAEKIVGKAGLDNAIIIVLFNSSQTAGTVQMTTPKAGIYEIAPNDYGCGRAIAYCAGLHDEGISQNLYRRVIHHEVGGHAFAKLADEGVIYTDRSPAASWTTRHSELMEKYGWWKNISYTDDPETIKWKHFIGLKGYEDVGIYEGAQYYEYDVWRPSREGIMYDSSVPGYQFNAPSREAIYYRIHKLAYGESWVYDFNKFLEYDKRNLQN